LNFTASPKSFQIRLIVENSYGCSDTSFKNMQVFPYVEARFASIDEGCSPFSVDFNNLSTGGNLFAWQFDDGDNSFLEEPEHTFVNNDTADAIFNVVLTVTSPYGCKDQDSLPILVHPTPKPQFIPNPTAQTYPDATVSFNNLTPVGPWNYTWALGDGTVSNDDEPQDHTYTTWGEYFITLTAASEYCEDTISRKIIINPPLPIADFDTLVEGCAPVSLQFRSSSEYAEKFFWEFGDGATSSSENPVYTYQFPGTYTVRLTVTGPAGDIDVKEIIDAVQVNPQPLANFVLTPNEVNIPLQPVTFVNYSQFADDYFWHFGDGVTSRESNPQHLYQESGIFYPWLVVSTVLGCFDTAYSQVPVNAIEVGQVQVPNAFTPNPFGPTGGYFDPQAFDNEVFFPILSGVSASNFTLSIFNRWGELIFETHDVGQGWDGYYRERMCQQDVYVWKVRGEYANGEKFTKVGDVTLVQ
jgi:gliding motility-associated-like protein